VREARDTPNQRVEPTDTERVRLRVDLAADGVAGEGVPAAPYRRLTREPLARAEGSEGPRRSECSLGAGWGHEKSVVAGRRVGRQGEGE